MLFNSPEFAFFFILVLVGVHLCNRRKVRASRNLLLLLASYGFYAWLELWFPILLAFVTLINYGGVQFLIRHPQRRVGIMAGIIVLSLLPLASLKYLPMWVPGLFLPAGLSFFTFQALTYSLDIYRKKLEPIPQWVDFALFVSFFPTQLSGPIERARNLLPQLQGPMVIKWSGLQRGASLFLWGLFKKAVIADRLALYVNEIYAVPGAHSGSTLALAAVLYSIQIYADFGGYASMARGAGLMLGVDLVDNFRFPYFACTVKEFWRRWHISLTSWFTEYVYISLGGNRVSQARWVVNIAAVFLLSGIWHGATWAFVAWGGIHALLYLTEHALGIKKGNPFYGLGVFLMVSLAWIFFRAGDVGLAWAIVLRIFTLPWGIPSSGASLFSLAVTCCLVLGFLLVEFIQYSNVSLPRLCKPAAWLATILLIALFGVSGNQFVYFQF